MSKSNNDDSMLFPQKLMDILADPSNQDTICWLPDGKSFVIRDRTLFSENVMPKYFPRKAKYSSFTRKLNRWNFMRVANGPEHGAYFHRYFLRDQPHLAAQMFCKNARTMLAMQSHTSDVVPNVESKQVNVTKPVLIKEASSSPMSISPVPSQIPSMASKTPMWTMTMKPSDSLNKGQFSSCLVPAMIPRSTSTDYLERRAMVMAQEKEQLNRLLIERALRIQQRSNVVRQQDRLLQMRQMIEMNMRQHHIQQQQKQQAMYNMSTTKMVDGTQQRVMSNNHRASAA